MSVQRIRFTEETDGIFREKLKKGKLETSLKKIRETGSIDQRHENGRRKHARTEENVTAADELVLGQGDGRPYTCRDIVRHVRNLSDRWPDTDRRV